MDLEIIIEAPNVASISKFKDRYEVNEMGCGCCADSHSISNKDQIDQLIIDAKKYLESLINFRNTWNQDSK